MNVTKKNNLQGTDETLPGVSIVIITKDRRKELAECLTSLSGLDYPKDKLEIIVVEEGDTPEPLVEVKYVFIPREDRGWGYARNVGVKNASQELVGFLDDDCIVPEEWLKKLVCSLTDDIGGVTGGVLVKNSNAIGYCENVLGFPNGGLLRIHLSGSKIQETVDLSTCNCLYRKEVFERVGYFFDAKNTRGTDMELALRVTKQYTCLFNPDAIVYHEPRGSFVEIFRWFLSRGRSQILLVPHLLQKGTHILSRLRNSLLIRLGLLAVFLYFVGPMRYSILLALIVGYYLVILKRYAFQLKYLKRYDTFFLTPVVKLTMDIGMEVGQLLELLKYAGRTDEDKQPE